MSLDNRIGRLAEARGITEEEIRKLIAQKIEETGGLLTEEGAIYALEKEYGVSSTGEEVTYTKISELKNNMNSVNILGVILEIRPIKKFKTEKRSGQLARFLVSDGTGETNVVLWDRAADLVNSPKVRPGVIIAVKNAYTREGADRKPEVHVGSLSRLVVSPQDIDENVKSSLPKVPTVEIKNIADLKENETASVEGRVLYTYPKSEFERADGRTGERASMIIEDKTGKIRVVLWDSNADRVSEFSEGHVVMVENGQVRAGNRGLEIHIGARGRVIPSDKDLGLPPLEPSKVYKLAEIKDGMPDVTVAGRVMRILPIRDFNTGDRAGRLASAIIADDTGMSRAVFWNDKTDLLSSMSVGDVILIKNAYTKKGLNGDVEIHLSKRGTVETRPKGVIIPAITTLMEKHAVEKRISDLEPNDRNIRIEGKVENIDERSMVFEVCSECGGRIENVGGEWVCDVCGGNKPAYNMVLSLLLSDGTGDIRVILYRDLAEEVSGMTVADVLNIVGKTGDETAPARELKERLIGKTLSVIGNVRYNDFQDRLELIAYSTASHSLASAHRADKTPSPALSDEKASSEEPPLEEPSSEEISTDVVSSEEVEIIKLDEENGKD